jgi:hypothetical protein
METELCALILAAASASAIALTAVPASAAPNPHQTAGFVSPVQLVAQACGAGWHRRPGWRDQYGKWHPGQCVPN